MVRKLASGALLRDQLWSLLLQAQIPMQL